MSSRSPSPSTSPSDSGACHRAAAFPNWVRNRAMLVNLVPEFLATLSAPDPAAAYHEYLDRHRPVLSAYWQNYVLDPASPHAEPIIATALHADRADLMRTLARGAAIAIPEAALR